MDRYRHNRRPGLVDEWCGVPPGLHLPQARSALFLDPMLLGGTALAGVIIAIAIPAVMGEAGRWGAALAR